MDEEAAMLACGEVGVSDKSAEGGGGLSQIGLRNRNIRLLIQRRLPIYMLRGYMSPVPGSVETFVAQLPGETFKFYDFGFL